MSDNTVQASHFPSDFPLLCSSSSLTGDSLQKENKKENQKESL